MTPDPDPLRSHLERLPPVRIVYTDLDGTLLGRDGSILRDAEGAPQSRTAAALVACAVAGVEVVPTTGRRAEQLREDLRLLGLARGIAEAGAATVDHGDIAIRWGACPPQAGTTPRAALADAHAVVLRLGGDDLRPYRPWDDGRVGGYLLHGRLDVASANAALADAGFGWARVLDNGVTGGWPGRDGVRAYHLVPHGIGKAAAVRADLIEQGIPPAAALAVGDSLEDATMADAVGTYVTVAEVHAVVGATIVRAPASGAAGAAWALELAAATAAASRRR